MDKDSITKATLETDDFQNMKLVSEKMIELAELCTKYDYPFILMAKGKTTIALDMSDGKYSMELVGMNKFVLLKLETQMLGQQEALSKLPNLVEEEQKQYAHLVTKGPVN